MQVVTAEQLLKDGRIDNFEYDRIYHDHSGIVFPSLRDASEFVCRFLLDHLSPKYGLEEARKLPVMGMHTPYEVAVAETEGRNYVLRPNLTVGERVWIIPNSMLPELQEYMGKVRQKVI